MAAVTSAVTASTVWPSPVRSRQMIAASVLI